MSGEVLDRMGAVGVGEGAGMPEFAVSHVIQGHSLRKAGIEPAGGLVDDAQVPWGWVSICDHKLQAGMALQRSDNYP